MGSDDPTLGQASAETPRQRVVDAVDEARAAIVHVELLDVLEAEERALD